MARIKIEIHSEKKANALLLFNNKIIMRDESNGMMIFKDVELIEEKETYGRRKNKTRTKYYIECEVLGYNHNGKFVGSFDVSNVKYILMHYDLYKMRRIYLEHIEALKAMQTEEEKLNELPVIDKVIQSLENGYLLRGVKLYKEGTGKSFKESKDYVLDVLKPKYYREPNRNV